jgi:outer membrane receptor protein involved in Fe transport
MKLKPIALAISAALIASPVVHAESEANIELESMEVQSGVSNKQKAGRLIDVIQQTEMISAETIEKKNASNLAEAIAGEAGIRVSNECSMCGVKRVKINGMKGEHTTVLIDGVPLFSGVAGFYGIDAFTAAGIGRIEIARGAGASLIAPEAIGGTINIVTKRPTKDSLVMDSSIGEDGYKRTSITGTAVSDDKATRLIGAAQYSDRDQFDGDNNGVSENPALENTSVFAKVTHDINESNTVDLRIASYRSDIFGGPTGVSKSETLSGFDDAGSNSLDLFAGGDVRKQFTGKPWETAETIKTDRTEVTGSWVSDLNDNTWLHITGAFAEHVQDSFYEGFDYYADDDLYYGDVKINHVLNDQHLFTFGVDYRDEKMRSRSKVVAADPSLTSDSYDHRDIGVYIQDEWTPTNALEVSMALRINHISVDFVDQANGDVIDETLFAPRLHIRYSHNEHWTSRLSAGKGYRAPLSVFETDHALLEGAFAVAITKLEESWGSNYALSYESERFSAVASLGWTEVENIATTDDSTPGVLTLINTNNTARATVFDIAAGYEITPALKFNGGFEIYNYSDSLKETFAIAPIETRVRAGFDYTKGAWKANTTLTWVGSRDLNDYGYGDRYAVFNDANRNGTVEAGELQNPKNTNAPSFFTFDARVDYQLTKSMNLYVGGINLFDYKQTDEESPLFWDADGGYDVGHIYAPLRGRMLYTGFKVSL